MTSATLTAPPAAPSKLADLRDVPLDTLEAVDLGAVLRRVLPGPEVIVVPVAAFQSSIG